MTQEFQAFLTLVRWLWIMSVDWWRVVANLIYVSLFIYVYICIYKYIHIYMYIHIIIIIIIIIIYHISIIYKHTNTLFFSFFKHANIKPKSNFPPHLFFISVFRFQLRSVAAAGYLCSEARAVSVFRCTTPGVNTSKHDDGPLLGDFPYACLRLTDYSQCDRHFRSHIVDKWVNIQEVCSFLDHLN